jgi:hypothetical protein
VAPAPGVLFCHQRKRVGRPNRADDPRTERVDHHRIWAQDSEVNHNLPDDLAPWFVRVAHNKVSVGIFACAEDDLWHLVDEVCEPDACEYKRLPPGGFVFGGEVVLHEAPDTENDHMRDCWLTHEWCAVYDDDGGWERIALP